MLIEFICNLYNSIVYVCSFNSLEVKLGRIYVLDYFGLYSKVWNNWIKN